MNDELPPHIQSLVHDSVARYLARGEWLSLGPALKEAAIAGEDLEAELKKQVGGAYWLDSKDRSYVLHVKPAAVLQAPAAKALDAPLAAVLRAPAAVHTRGGEPAAQAAEWEF